MRVESSVTFAADHPVFAGHFPGRPIVPGALLLDEVLHAALQAIRASKSELARLALEGPSEGPPSRPTVGSMGRCQIASVKFLSPVEPGETLVIACISSASGATRFDVSCHGRPVATGTFVLEFAQ